MQWVLFVPARQEHRCTVALATDIKRRSGKRLNLSVPMVWGSIWMGRGGVGWKDSLFTKEAKPPWEDMSGGQKCIEWTLE